MPIPSTVSDLSATAASNYPTGAESVGPSLDDYLRSHAAIIRQVSDAKADTGDVALKASTADLSSTASSKGASLIGYETTAETVKAALDVRVPEIGTYALLRAYTGALTALYVRGMASIFDGGSGIFRVDSSDTTSADNGGTILVGGDGRRWKRDVTEQVSLKWFAKGDGTTDDTTSIQAANDYCTTNKRTLFVQTPGAQYLVTSTVNITCSMVGEMPVDKSAGVAQFKTTSNINVFNVYGSRLRIENIGIQYSLGALATSAAVGFLFGNSTTQFSRSVVRHCFVRYAYDSFKANTAGSGTLWGNVFESCHSDLHVNRPFNFDCVNGSTSCEFNLLYCIGDTTGGNKPKGYYFNRITDMNVGIIAADYIYNDALSINNGNAVIDEVRFESCVLDTASAALITSAACHLDIRQIYSLGLTCNVGAGNRGGLLRPPTGAYTAKVGVTYAQGTTTTSGTLYKFIVGSLSQNRGLVINDATCATGDIYYNGYDACVELNGKVSIPAFAFMLGTWAAGDFVWNRAPAEAGTASSKYVINGWTRLTTGSGHVINTDWIQSRSLTGN